MTKKDYVEIASVMLYARPVEKPEDPNYCREAVETWARAVDEFVRRFQGQNPRFNAVKFRKACGA